VGIAVVLGRGNPVSLFNLAFGTGDLWVLVAAGAWAGYTVASKRFPLPPLPAIVRLAVLVGGGALMLAPFAGVETLQGEVPDFSDGRLYAALAFLALVPSLGAYFCFDQLVRVAGADGASTSMYLVPLYATLAAWPLLGEIPQAFHVAGFMLILGGVLWAGSGRGTLAVRSGG
jgi:drug/metabolite transporter (DMT)-like permease